MMNITDRIFPSLSPDEKAGSAFGMYTYLVCHFINKQKINVTYGIVMFRYMFYISNN